MFSGKMTIGKYRWLLKYEKKPAFDQSNLIALNAMFEAARNGQAGLNLAVASEKMKDFLSDSKPK